MSGWLRICVDPSTGNERKRLKEKAFVKSWNVRVFLSLFFDRLEVNLPFKIVED